MTEATANVYDAEAYRQLIVAVRSADVTGNNKATDWARPTLARMVNDPAFDIDVLTAAVCSVYKPCTAKGKRSDTIGALRASGWDAMAKRLTDCKFIASKFAVEGVLEAVNAFTASTSAKDTFAALNLTVRELVKAAGKAAAGNETEGEGEGEDIAGPNGDKSPMDALAAIEAMAAFLDGLNDADCAALATDIGQETLLRLSDALNRANDRGFALVESSQPLAEAA